jgi:DNA polymerase delta subunit 2
LFNIFLSLIYTLWFEQEQGLAAQIVHVVIAGNSFEFPRKLINGQNLASKDQSTLYEPIKELDIMLSQVS